MVDSIIVETLVHITTFSHVTRILEHLGSGQFGTVSKGLWSISNNSLLLAIKQLPSGASSEERVKLLQEAAIMGQFSHRNVVKLYGLVTIKQPVSIIK